MGKFTLRLSTNIVLLGLTSLLTDLSSEMITPILPLFIAALGGAAVAIGLIGGLGDSLSSILQVFSGYWSDRPGKRKSLVILGYSSSAFAKLFFPLSAAWTHLLVLRPIERIGKGLRTAPRDAIIAESSADEIRGKAFGFHRALDSAGAVLGSASAFILYWFLNLPFRPILLIAAVIAFTALTPLIMVKEKKVEARKLKLKISLAALPRKLRFFISTATVFSAGNFTYMFLILRAQESFAQTFPPRVAVAIPILLYILFNLVYSSFAMPSGMLSDKIGRKKVLTIGYAVFGFTYLAFAFPASTYLFVALFCSYGLAYALVDGTQRALVSDLSLIETRGTALGTFHTCTGLATLPGSLIAGFLWQYVNPAATFIYGFILCIAASAFLAYKYS